MAGTELNGLELQKIYVDTSVYGGCFEPEYADSCLALFDRLHGPAYQIVTSAVVEREILAAPLHVQEMYYRQSAAAIVARESPESLGLMYSYLREGVITMKWVDDGRHIAIATVNGCAGLASLNFKHLVKHEKASRFNQVNLQRGYNYLDIRRPGEFANDER